MSADNIKLDKLTVVSIYKPDHDAQIRGLKFLLDKGEPACQSPPISEYRHPIQSKRA
jgi:hypothetical protein